MLKKKIIALSILLLLLLSACGGKKYKVDYQGQKQFFSGAKDSYPAGAKVKLVFDLIATDTDYTFYVDGKPFNADWKNEGYVLEFEMPDHDIEVYYDSVNSMTYVEVYEPDQTEEE